MREQLIVKCAQCEDWDVKLWHEKDASKLWNGYCRGCGTYYQLLAMPNFVKTEEERA